MTRVSGLLGHVKICTRRCCFKDSWISDPPIQLAWQRFVQGSPHRSYRPYRVSGDQKSSLRNFQSIDSAGLAVPVEVLPVVEQLKAQIRVWLDINLANLVSTE
jgi:hypothetical protein